MQMDKDIADMKGDRKMNRRRASESRQEQIKRDGTDGLILKSCEQSRWKERR